MMANPSDKGARGPSGPIAEPRSTGTAAPSAKPATPGIATPPAEAVVSVTVASVSEPVAATGAPVATPSGGYSPQTSAGQHSGRALAEFRLRQRAGSCLARLGVEGDGADRCRRGPSAGGAVCGGRRPRAFQHRRSAEDARRRGDPQFRARNRQRSFGTGESVAVGRPHGSRNGAARRQPVGAAFQPQRQ